MKITIFKIDRHKAARAVGRRADDTYNGRMKPTPFWLALLLAAPHPASGGSVPSKADWQDLRQGRPVVSYNRPEAAGGAIRVALLFHGPPEPIWAVLLSCERTFEYVDGLRTCQTLEDGLEHAVVRQSVKKTWLLPPLDFLVEFERVPFVSIAFHQVEGDLRLLEGRWRFELLPEDDMTLVTLDMQVQSRFPVPRWLVQRSLSRDLPDMLQCLRALSGASGSDAQASRDREACPAS